jgi:hypothetical protein
VPVKSDVSVRTFAAIPLWQILWLIVRRHSLSNASATSPIGRAFATVHDKVRMSMLETWVPHDGGYL